MEPKPLRDVRRLRLLSIQALADKAGVSTKTVLDIEHGRTVPQFRTMAKLSDALGVEPLEVEEFAAAIQGHPTGKAAA